MLFFVFTSIYLLNIAVCQIVNEQCPPLETITPCECTSSKDMWPSINCNKLNSLNDLQTALNRGMKGHTFSDMTLHECNLGKLPSDLFEGINIESLTIIHSNLTELGDGIYRPPFLGLEYSLKYLELHGIFKNDMLPLKSLSLSHLKKLELLMISQNLISSIGNDWFESGPYNLKNLYITDSFISKLGSHAFAALTELKQLSLSGGKLNVIKRDMLPKPALHLESLDLSNNAFDTLPVDLFTKMPNLEDIFLGGNKIVTIDEAQWAPVWHQVIHIDLLGNPLTCDENIKWLYQYRLPGTIEGKCVNPSSKKGKELKKLTFSDFE